MRRAAIVSPVRTRVGKFMGSQRSIVAMPASKTMPQLPGESSRMGIDPVSAIKRLFARTGLNWSNSVIPEPRLCMLGSAGCRIRQLQHNLA